MAGLLSRAWTGDAGLRFCGPAAVLPRGLPPLWLPCWTSYLRSDPLLRADLLDCRHPPCSWISHYPEGYTAGRIAGAGPPACLAARGQPWGPVPTLRLAAALICQAGRPCIPCRAACGRLTAFPGPSCQSTAMFLPASYAGLGMNEAELKRNSVLVRAARLCSLSGTCFAAGWDAVQAQKMAWNPGCTDGCNQHASAQTVNHSTHCRQSTLCGPESGPQAAQKAVRLHR